MASIWSHSRHCSSIRSARRRRPDKRSRKRSRNGLKSSYCDDEDLPLGMLGVVVGQVAGQLQPDGRLARALFAEHHRRGRLGRVAVDLVPGRMERAADARALEHQVGLGVLVGKGIAAMP